MLQNAMQRVCRLLASCSAHRRCRHVLKDADVVQLRMQHAILPPLTTSLPMAPLSACARVATPLASTRSDVMSSRYLDRHNATLLIPSAWHNSVLLAWSLDTQACACDELHCQENGACELGKEKTLLNGQPLGCTVVSDKNSRRPHPILPSGRRPKTGPTAHTACVAPWKSSGLSVAGLVMSTPPLIASRACACIMPCMKAGMHHAKCHNLLSGQVS